MKSALILLLIGGTLASCIKEGPSKRKQSVSTLSQVYLGTWIVTDSITDTDPQAARTYYQIDTGTITITTDTGIALHNFLVMSCPVVHAHVTYTTITLVRDSLCGGADFPEPFSAQRRDTALLFEYSVLKAGSVYPLNVHAQAVRK
jgi:hypothetical protein